jgi:feruloyl-CoA synthase
MSEPRAPYAPTKFAKPNVQVEPLAGGGWLLSAIEPVAPHPEHLIVWLRQWAKRAPDRDFLCERNPAGEWRRVTYAEAAESSANIAQALIDRGHGPERPVAILSDNAVDHALLMFGAMHIGAPAMPVSPAYSLMSQDHEKLRAIVAHTDPGVVYVADARPFAKALAALDLRGRTLVTSAASDGAERLGDWMRVKAGREVDRRLAAIGPDAVGKILLTSGSTGLPKGVINTQRMMCANQAMVGFAWRFATERPPILVDWLPWNHTFGGNFNLNFVLANGGTLYVDEGRPAPGRFEATIRNLKAVSPTVYLNVPRGFDLIVPAMEADAALRNAVFRDLDMLFFAGAAMPPNLRLRLEKLSVAARGLRVPVITSLGSTETAPSATMMCWDSDVSGDIGLPLPGCIAKLVPNGDKLEVRFKGPHITPGYYRAPHLTAAAFDEEGYFRIGDAARLLDPADPAKGLVFDGRVAENFKLMSGTWVHAGMLRISAIDAAAPAIQDAVVTGHDREEVGLLAFPSLAGCRTLCGAPETATLADLICRPEVRARVAEGLARHNARNPGSSTRIARALLMAEPPAIDANEITDKGYINQRAVLARRAALVERLYAVKPGPDVVLAPPGPR